MASCKALPWGPSARTSARRRHNLTNGWQKKPKLGWRYGSLRNFEKFLERWFSTCCFHIVSRLWIGNTSGATRKKLLRDSKYCRRPSASCGNSLQNKNNVTDFFKNIKTRDKWIKIIVIMVLHNGYMWVAAIYKVLSQNGPRSESRARFGTQKWPPSDHGDVTVRFLETVVGPTFLEKQMVLCYEKHGHMMKTH